MNITVGAVFASVLDSVAPMKAFVAAAVRVKAVSALALTAAVPDKKASSSAIRWYAELSLAAVRFHVSS